MRMLISLFSVCFVIACSVCRVVRVQAWQQHQQQQTTPLSTPRCHFGPASCSKLVQINGTKEDSYYYVM